MFNILQHTCHIINYYTCQVLKDSLSESYIQGTLIVICNNFIFLENWGLPKTFQH